MSARPNFWSSWAVAMNSWVCASTPTVTRICTGWRTPSSSATCATRTISSKESSTIRPTPASTARRISAVVLLLPWKAIRAAGDPGVQRGGQLAAGADVEVEPLLVQPADDGAGEERLARVEDVGVGPEGVAPGAAAGPEVGLVQEEGGGAELLGEAGDRQAADGQHAVLVAADGTRPDLGVEGVEVLGRGAVVALGQDVGVAGPGGVGGTAHDAVSLTFTGGRVR